MVSATESALRKRISRRDRGSILATMAISIAFTALILVLIGSALSATAKTRNSKEFTLAGEQSDNAMSSAIDQLNNSNTALPTAGSPASSTGDTPATGGWKWWTVPAAGQGGMTGAIDTQGSFGKTKRTTVASLYSALMSAATVNSVVDYQIAPSAAFAHAMFGNGIQIAPGTATGSTPASAATTVTGLVGGAGGIISFTGGALATGGLTIYGTGTGSVAPSSMASITSPMPMNFDANAINALYAAPVASGGCNGAGTAWKASALPLVSNMRTIAASTTTICATSISIDAPLKITGPGVVNILMPAVGSAAISFDVTADTNASLAIYGGAGINLTGAAPTRTLANTYLYSPAGTCGTGTSGVQASFTGSMACQTIVFAGKAVWRPIDTNGATPLTIEPNLTTSRIWWTTNSTNSGTTSATGS